MAHAGQTIVNPVSGERITFRKTSADTNGEAGGPSARAASARPTAPPSG